MHEMIDKREASLASQEKAAPLLQCGPEGHESVSFAVIAVELTTIVTTHRG
jgi:hypothetical protein